MDWSRAKSVLILAFLVLNMLLGYQLWMDELNLRAFSQNAAKRDEMNRMLEMKEIHLQAVVPEGMPVLKELTVRVEHTGQADKWEALSRNIPVSQLRDAGFIRNLLAPVIPQIEHYAPDPYQSANGIFVMHQLYNELPMFPMRLELAAEAGQITKYKMAYAAEVDPADEETSKEQQVLSAYTVLGNLAEYYLPQGSVIVDVRLGYHGPIFESETQVLAPYWRIVLSEGETYYVHAVTGAVEGPST